MIDLAPDELIIDSFAGGGGASLGIAQALGRGPDVAINHDDAAVAMHAANHPETLHLCQSVWKAFPQMVVAEAARHRGLDPARARVGLFWASPDCKHFSKAKGGKPVEKKIRDLAWVVVHYARLVRPRVIFLENVEEFQDWGPLVETEAGKLMPCPVQKGLTFKRWVRELKREGYAVDWRNLRACDYGAPTIRKRLFVIARRDGKPIVWPAPTHAKPGPDGTVPGGLKPWRTAAEIIDWSLPCPSIFLTKEEGRAIGVKRPLESATMARIAAGTKRYVIDAGRPFLIPVTHKGDLRTHDSAEPLRTVTTAKRGELALVAPHITKFRANSIGLAADEPMHTITSNSHRPEGREGGAPPFGVVAATLVQTGYGERKGQAPRALDAAAPLGTVVAGGAKHAAVAAFLAQHNTGMIGHPPDAPVSTIVGKGCTQAIVAAHLSDLHGTSKAGRAADAPAATVAAGGNHHAAVVAFLTKYYGQGGQDQSPAEPAHTIPTKARLALTMVRIEGEPWWIVDIGMRMLTPRELFLAQGFPPDYAIVIEFEGKPLSKAKQIRMCGNSVCPPVAEALVRANFAVRAVEPLAGAAE